MLLEGIASLTSLMSPSKRKPWVAGLLSLVVPGLGHLYAGNLQRAVALFFIVELSVLLFFASCFNLVLSSFVIAPFNVALAAFALLLFLLVYFYTIRAAVQLARGAGDTYTLKPYNRWYVYVVIVVIVAVIPEFLLTDWNIDNLVETHQMSSGSMAPSILKDERIVTEKVTYRDSDPARGDVIIFKYPEDETKDFVKRVIGLPGDVIEIRSKVVFVNGRPLNDVAYTQRADPGMINGSINPRDNLGLFTVPRTHYFVLGDNRDQSLDSRFFGPVERSKIGSRASVIYWSSDGWSIRWNRIGQSIQ